MLNLWSVPRLVLFFLNRDVFQLKLLGNHVVPFAKREDYRRGRRRLLGYFVCSFSFVRSSAVETFFEILLNQNPSTALGETFVYFKTFFNFSEKRKTSSKLL